MSGIKALEKLRELCVSAESEGFSVVGRDAVWEIADEIEREHAQRVAGLTGDLCSYEWRNKELKDALKAICKRFGVSSTKWSAEDAAKKVLEALERDYMPLPVDADGVPIRIGDVMGGGIIGRVTYIGEHRVCVLKDDYHLSVSYLAEEIRHVKPRTLEDVLREFTDEVIEWSGYSGPVSGDKTWSGVAGKYVDEIRAMFGEGADE